MEQWKKKEGKKTALYPLPMQQVYNSILVFVIHHPFASFHPSLVSVPFRSQCLLNKKDYRNLSLVSTFHYML